MKLKAKIVLATICLTAIVVSAQNRLKGNKIVTIENRDISHFSAIEVLDDIDVYLYQGSNPHLNVETDENLQNAVQAKVEGETLKIYFSENIAKSKKMVVQVTVTEKLKLISAHKNSNIYADSRIILRELTLNAFDNADYSMKLDVDDFKIIGAKNSDLKINVFSKNLKTNLSESCELGLEGEIDQLIADISGNSSLHVKGSGKSLEVNATTNGGFKGRDFKVNTAVVTAAARTDLFVNAIEKISITAKEKAEITVYNKPEIELLKFEGNAKLHKKKL